MIPVFKAVNTNMSAPQDEHFFYPTSGFVRDRDGWGLHGLPWGIGPSHWYDFIEEPKYLILVAPEVTHYIGQGKCSFIIANVVGCYTNISDAAKHMSRLTRNWTTPDALKRFRYVPEEHRHLVRIARATVQPPRINQEAIDTQKRRKAERHALREAYRNAIYVPSWPVQVPQTLTIKQERKITNGR